MSKFSAKNSRVMREFNRDLVKYRKLTGKTNNTVIATKALDFSFKFKKELADVAPSLQRIDAEVAAAGHALRIRAKARRFARAEGSYKGSIKRTYRGQVYRNKRALAAARELAIRRSSRKFLSASIAKWQRADNENIDEGSKLFGQAYTQGRKSVVGVAQGKFTARRDQVVVKGFAYAIDKVQRSKGGLVDKALRSSSRGTRNFMLRRHSRLLGASFKKLYK